MLFMYTTAPAEQGAHSTSYPVPASRRACSTTDPTNDYDLQGCDASKVMACGDTKSCGSHGSMVAHGYVDTIAVESTPYCYWY